MALTLEPTAAGGGVRGSSLAHANTISWVVGPTKLALMTHPAPTMIRHHAAALGPEYRYPDVPEERQQRYRVGTTATSNPRHQGPSPIVAVGPTKTSA